MRTISQILFDARTQHSYSLERLEKETKIKSTFIGFIEKGEWEKLPPFPTVLGFIKSIAGELNIDEKLAIATLKRDYPPKKLTKITPKPDVSSPKFSWSPKLTFAVGVICILIIFFGYLIFQYVKFVSPPKLYVDSPKEGQLIEDGGVTVFGKTDSDVKIIVNNQPVLVSNDGKFSVELEVSENTKEIVIIGTSRSGKETVVRRKIVVK